MDIGNPTSETYSTSFRRVVRLVALLNLAYFGVEFGVARWIGSVSLFADSIDFLEDTAVNALILLALDWSAGRRSLVGILLSVILLVPGLSTLWTAWEKLAAPVPPNAMLLSFTGSGALVVNLFCAYLLVGFRSHGGSLARAAFLSARNDALGNIAIVAAGLLTSQTPSPWPDLVVGLGIFMINLDAAREVYTMARRERSSASTSDTPVP